VKAYIKGDRRDARRLTIGSTRARAASLLWLCQCLGPAQSTGALDGQNMLRLYVIATDLEEAFMKISKIVVISFLLVWPLATAAQEPTTMKKQELIRELLVVTDANNSATKIIDSIIGEMNRQYPQMVERLANADPSLTPAQRQKAKRVLSENHAQYSKQLLERIKQRVDIGQVVESISSSLYDKYFTEEEIKDLISFYKTSTGKKTLSVMPQYFAESLQRTGEKLLPILTTIITEMAAEEKERIKRIK
jgi:hypothetical protein